MSTKTSIIWKEFDNEILKIHIYKEMHDDYIHFELEYKSLRHDIIIPDDYCIVLADYLSANGSYSLMTPSHIIFESARCDGKVALFNQEFSINPYNNNAEISLTLPEEITEFFKYFRGDKNLEISYLPNPSYLKKTYKKKANRVEKIRGFLEKRFYRYGKLNKTLYQKVGGDLKFLGL